MTDPSDLRPYAGRWVARVNGRVTGHGTTEAEARLAAQHARPKEVPEVIFVSDRRPLNFPPLFDRVREVLAHDPSIWLVGGSVRDALIGRETHDLDFAVDGDALDVARRVARTLGAAFYPLDDQRDTGRVILESPDGEREYLDFARLRAPGIIDDLKARDFTLDAMAVPLNDTDSLIDPTQGEPDLRAKLLRATSSHAIADDPIRALRGIRLAAQFDLRVDRATREQMRTQAGSLSRVSAERVRDEFIRVINGRRPAAALRALDALGILESIIPEIRPMKGVSQPPPHTLDVWEHSLLTVDRLEALLAVLGPTYDPDAAADLTLGLATVKLGRHRFALHDHFAERLSDERPARALLMFSALLHDVGKPETRTVAADGRIRFFEHDRVGAGTAASRAAKLRLAKSEADRIRATVRHHMRPLFLAQAGDVSTRAIYRFFRDAGRAGVDVAVLSLADTLATYGHTLPQEVWQLHVDVSSTLLRGYYESRDSSVAPPPLLTGDDLIKELGLSPGRRLGQLLEAIREAQAAGEVEDHQAALEFARRQLNRL